MAPSSTCWWTRPQARPSPDVVDRLSRMRGQGLVEYGLILALTAVFTVVILVVFGGTLADFLSLVGDAIDSATGG